MKIMED